MEGLPHCKVKVFTQVRRSHAIARPEKLTPASLLPFSISSKHTDSLPCWMATWNAEMSGFGSHTSSRVFVSVWLLFRYLFVLALKESTSLEASEPVSLCAMPIVFITYPVRTLAILILSVVIQSPRTNFLLVCKHFYTHPPTSTQIRNPK
jgi:hypothetical protein